MLSSQDVMGLGKTIQVIGTIDYLIKHGLKGPFLVVVPLSSTLTTLCTHFLFSPFAQLR